MVIGLCFVLIVMGFFVMKGFFGKVANTASCAMMFDLTRDAAIAYSKERREEFAQSLLGDSPEALGRCFEVGMRMLARARASCGASSNWQHGMFSMYGTGTTCNAGVLRNRSQTFQRMRALATRMLSG